MKHKKTPRTQDVTLFTRKPHRRQSVASNRPSPCPECEKFKTCRSLCGPVRRWADQDQVGGGDLVLENSESGFGNSFSLVDMAFIKDHSGTRDDDVAEYAFATIMAMNLPPKIVEFIELYYLQGVRKCEIARRLNMSDSAINVRHSAVRIVIRDRLLRKKMHDTMMFIKLDSDLANRVFDMYFESYISRKDIAETLGIRRNIVYGIIRRISAMYFQLDTTSRV